jgi:hypothetical protein
MVTQHTALFLCSRPVVLGLANAVFAAPTAARALRCRALKEPCPYLAVLFSHGHPIATRARVAFDTTSTVSALGRRPSRPDSDQSGWRCHASPAYRHAKDTACTTFVYQERDRTPRIELIVLCPTNVDANGIAWQSFHFSTKDRLLIRPCRAVSA